MSRKSSPPSSDPYNATVSSWHQLSPEAAIFRVKPDTGQTPDFEAGQFATLALTREHPPLENPHEFPAGDPRWKKLIRRAYSIASSPLERTYLEFYAVIVPEGKLTPKLWRTGIGTRLWLDPRIKGDFTLQRVPDGKDLIMLATGTGLAPYISMLKTYRGTDRWRRFVIIHSARVQDDLGYREELERIAADDPSVIYLPTLTREPPHSSWTGHRGRVTALLDPDHYRRAIGADLDPDQAHVFLCGNPQMINDCEAMLLPRGFVVNTPKQPGNLHFERYW